MSLGNFLLLLRLLHTPTILYTSPTGLFTALFCYFLAPCFAFPVAAAALITSCRQEVPVIEVLQERGEAGEDGEDRDSR